MPNGGMPFNPYNPYANPYQQPFEQPPQTPPEDESLKKELAKLKKKLKSKEKDDFYQGMQDALSAMQHKIAGANHIEAPAEDLLPE